LAPPVPPCCVQAANNREAHRSIIFFSLISLLLK
jgi:hypothetical protein